METREKLRGLIDSMDEDQRSILAQELAAALDTRRASRVNVEDITVDRMRDPAFAAEVRAEVEAALKGLR